MGLFAPAEKTGQRDKSNTAVRRRRQPGAMTGGTEAGGIDAGGTVSGRGQACRGWRRRRDMPILKIKPAAAGRIGHRRASRAD